MANPGTQTRKIANKRFNPTIIIIGWREPVKLDERAQTGSRLSPSIREPPASIEMLTQNDLQAPGLRTTREAFNDVVGAISGNVPGNPAFVSLCGFTGNNTSILQDACGYRHSPLFSEAATTGDAFA